MRQLAGLIPAAQPAQLRIIAEFLDQLTRCGEIVNRLGNQGGCQGAAVFKGRPRLCLPPIQGPNGVIASTRTNS